MKRAHPDKLKALTQCDADKKKNITGISAYAIITKLANIDFLLSFRLVHFEAGNFLNTFFRPVYIRATLSDSFA